MYIHVYIYVCVCVCVQLIHTHVFNICIRNYKYTYIYMCVCVYIYIYIYIYDGIWLGIFYNSACHGKCLLYCEQTKMLFKNTAYGNKRLEWTVFLRASLILKKEIMARLAPRECQPCSEKLISGHGIPPSPRMSLPSTQGVTEDVLTKQISGYYSWLQIIYIWIYIYI